jgi:glycosyltransferase involved in cell wall biosynthesis
MLPARRVLVASRAVATQQAALFRCPPISIVQPGVDLGRLASVSGTEVRARAGIPPNAPLAGIVGRLQPWKGQSVFIDAARLVLNDVPDAWFVVVGGAEMGWEQGDYPGELRDQARALRIEDRVVFTGHTDLALEWTAALDVAVNASNPEPFGLVVIEAMALGVTTVAVAAGGPLDIITDSVDGLLVFSPTPEAFARQIVRALTDHTLRRKLGAAAQQAVEANYTVERLAQQFGHVMRDVLRSAHSPPRPQTPPTFTSRGTA